MAVWLRLAPFRRTTAFGAANLIALGILAGPAVAVAGLTLATGMWTVLSLANGGRSRLLTALAYATPTTVFLGYKAVGDWSVVRAMVPTGGPVPDAVGLLIALSFSYVFLRGLDATRAVLAKGSPLL